MPAQKPGKSIQTYGTPRNFLDALDRRFGPIAVDLAADRSNHVVDRWLGPGGEHEDAFKVDWYKLAPGEWLFLNPPFARIEPWAKKCCLERRAGARILLLVPASIGSEWFHDYCEHEARTIGLRERLIFVGETQGYPKDLALIVYDTVVAFETWRWDA